MKLFVRGLTLLQINLKKNRTLPTDQSSQRSIYADRIIYQIYCTTDRFFCQVLSERNFCTMAKDKSEIQVFNNPEFGGLRTLMIDNEPYFVGKDVATILEYSDAGHAILDHVDEEDRINSKTQGQNDPEFGQRGTWLINESGLYSLILSSKLPAAKKFKRWVTSEVLPTIRKTGGYKDETLYEMDERLSGTTIKVNEALAKRMVAETQMTNAKTKQINSIAKLMETMTLSEWEKRRYMAQIMSIIK